MEPSLSFQLINVGNFTDGNNFSKVENGNFSTTNHLNTSVFDSKMMVPLYASVFILSMVGNTLILFTLMRNKRMRTVTNVYLLNLAVADLLLGVFCMPITLIGQIIRNFLFGPVMCKLIPYFQAVSISVSIWTLVAISMERYFAICRPLTSRRWQTRNHASKMIFFVWTASFICSIPILLVQQLQPIPTGHKCREQWPSNGSEQMYNLFLNVILFLLPLTIMSSAYFMIVEKLWKGMQREIQHSSCQKLVSQKSNSSPNQKNALKTKNVLVFSENGNVQAPKRCLHCFPTIGDLTEKKPVPANYCLINEFMQVPAVSTCSHQNKEAARLKDIIKETTYTFARQGIRSNYIDRSIEAKRKVIRMLFVIVAEFFICWTPLHIFNTCYVYFHGKVYEKVSPTEVSLIHLLAYITSCSNPITYCFMNRKFRQAFLAAFKCRMLCIPESSPSISNMDGRHKKVVLKKDVANSENSCNDSMLFVGRISYSGRSEPKAEDRV